MAEIVLIKLESDDGAHRIAPPFGILYVASALEAAGFSVRLVHEIGTRAAIDRLIGEIKDERPRLAGFSTLSGRSLLPARAASIRLKAETGLPIVWGGLHPTMLPEQTLAEPCVDYVVLGEGEETLADLARALRDGPADGRAEGIPGLGLKAGGDVRINPPRPFIADLDAYRPAWRLLPIERYLYSRKFFLSDFGSSLPGGRIAPYITSRGCPWRCGYCYNQFVNRRSFRAHSAERVIADVERLKSEHGVTAVVFEDDNLFTDKDRALRIVRGIGLPWSSSLRADAFTRWGADFVGELRRTGCIELRIGAESGSPRVLELMGKDITVADIRRSAELCRAHGINALYNFMAGIPGETWADTLETFDLMDELEDGGGGVVVNGPSVYFPWPGTPLFEEAVRLGFDPPRTMEGWATRWGAEQKTAPYADRRVRYVSFYRSWAFRKDVSGRRFPAFARLLSAAGRRRWRRRFFRFPLDYLIPKAIVRGIGALGLGRLARGIAADD